MYRYKQNPAQITDASKHKDNVTQAVMIYITLERVTIDDLAKTFQVSGNTINKWFCEAVANNYLPNTTMCKQLINKHIAEYERKHNIKNSCLRQMYKYAIVAGNTNIVVNV